MTSLVLYFIFIFIFNFLDFLYINSILWCLINCFYNFIHLWFLWKLILVIYIAVRSSFCLVKTFPKKKLSKVKIKKNWNLVRIYTHSWTVACFSVQLHEKSKIIISLNVRFRKSLTFQIFIFKIPGFFLFCLIN